ncbi:MAG TPA: hypothetical protein PK303_03080 [bacterium]|nr:hypothetical protein [bacterium]HOL34434.1 hypothetical protein [bacterium]HPP08088.1 hypothetical protein [bacterium]
MPSCKVKAYVLKNIARPILNWQKEMGIASAQGTETTATSYAETMGRNKDYYHNLISFTTVEYHPEIGLVYCGITAADNDILWTFDPETKKFNSLHFEKYGEKYDIKIHRSLIIDDDGTIYGATAGLVEPFEYLDAPGGKIFSLNPKTNEMKILCIPCPHDYIQTIAMDKKRKIIYGFTWPCLKFFRYDIKTNKAINFDWVGSYPHIPCVDDDGNLWGQWANAGSSNANLLRYNPETNKIDFLRKALPKLYTTDNSGIDGMINGEDGYIYIGTVSGALMRLDPKNVEIKYLGKPYPGTRLAGLCIGKDGLIYGGGGENYNTYVFAYDREKEKFITFGRVYDPEINDACVIVHHITITEDRTIYAAETDNLERSGFLWECKVNP